MGRFALILGSVLFTSTALAQPAGETELDSDAKAQPAPPADPPPVVKDPKAAKRWLQAGDKLIQKGDQLTKAGKTDDAKIQYDNAVTAYQKAIDASDDMTTLLPLAVALDKSGSTPDAMKQLKRLVITPAIKPEIVKKAQAKLDELSMKIGLVTLVITPEGTTVSIAGKPVGEAPLPDALVLAPGTHKVSFTAVGYQPKDVDLKVEAGSESERKVALEPVPVVTKPQETEEPVEEPVRGPGGPSMVPLYVGGGATIGLTLVATVTGIIALGAHGTFTDPDTSESARSDAQSSGKMFARVTDFALVGALGAAAFTTYWYLYKYKPQAESQTQAKVSVVPWVQPEAGGVVVGSSF